jgi:hypothetical protein
VTFESHLEPAQDVQDHAIPIIECWRDSFRAGFGGQLEKISSVQLVKPGQVPSYLTGMNSTARDMRHAFCFTGQDGRAWERPEISVASSRADVVLPALREPAGHVKRCPAEI